MNNKMKISIIILLLSIFNTSLALDNCKSELKNSSYNDLSSSNYEKVITFWENLHKKFISKSNSEQSDIFWKYISILSDYKSKSNLDWVKLDIINLLVDQFQCKKEYVLKLELEKNIVLEPVISAEDKIKYPWCDKENIIKNGIIAAWCPALNKAFERWDFKTWRDNTNTLNNSCSKWWHIPSKEETKEVWIWWRTSSYTDIGKYWRSYYYWSKWNKVAKFQSPYWSSIICFKNNTSDYSTICDKISIWKRNIDWKICKEIKNDVIYRKWYYWTQKINIVRNQRHCIDFSNWFCNESAVATDSNISTHESCQNAWDYKRNPMPNSYSKVMFSSVINNWTRKEEVKNWLKRINTDANCMIQYNIKILELTYTWK